MFVRYARFEIACDQEEIDRCKGIVQDVQRRRDIGDIGKKLDLPMIRSAVRLRHRSGELVLCVCMVCLIEISGMRSQPASPRADSTDRSNSPPESNLVKVFFFFFFVYIGYIFSDFAETFAVMKGSVSSPASVTAGGSVVTPQALKSIPAPVSVLLF